jgi:hypothetical protein
MVEVMDAAAFLERTAPWVGRAEVDAHVQHLRKTVAALSNMVTAPENILSVMGSEEACELLGKFIADSKLKRRSRPYQGFQVQRELPSGSGWKEFSSLS